MESSNNPINIILPFSDGKALIVADLKYLEKVTMLKAKNKSYIKEALPLLLILFCITISASLVKQADAQQTRLYISPASVTISQPGENAIVEVYIANVANLYAYEFKIFYLNSIVNATEVVRPPGHFMEPSDPTSQFVPKWEIKNNFNETHGRIWLGFTLLMPEAPRSGSGILTRITFKGIAVGSTTLYLKDTKLADSAAASVPHIAENGEIIVVPEFPMITVTILMLIVMTAVLMLRKMINPRKYQ